MVWKPKEKEFSKEEAIAMAKTELAPFWIGSSPLIGAVKVKKNIPAKVYPLDPAFIKSTWIILFCDPFSYDGVSSLTFLREWAARYIQLGLQFLLVLRSDMQMDAQSRNTFMHLKKSGLDLPIAIDADGAIGDAFQVKTSAKMLLLNGEKTEMEFSSDHLTVEWFQATESAIQNYLRKKDRGLPLPRLFFPDFTLVADKEKFVFGSAAPNWNSRVQLTGKHQIEADRIIISDNTAVLTLGFSTTSLGLVARSLSKSGSACKLLVEVDGKPIFDTFSDKDVDFEESGLSFVACGDLNFYLLVKGLRKGQHELRIVFPQSQFNPVALYRIVLGN